MDFRFLEAHSGNREGKHGESVPIAGIPLKQPFVKCPGDAMVAARPLPHFPA